MPCVAAQAIVHVIAIVTILTLAPSSSGIDVFNSTGIRLLLVLNEPVLAGLTSFRLELLGYQVQTVPSGNEASAAISKSVPDLVIVDTALRDGDGIEWIARMRSDQDVADMPVMIISLDPSLETVERAYHAGVQEYLISPYDPIVLEQKIEGLVIHQSPKRKRKQGDPNSAAPKKAFRSGAA